MADKEDKWLKKWQEAPDHKKNKENTIKLIDNYLKVKPKRMLEIGCGLAYESEYFHKKYGTEIWLLDGEWNAKGRSFYNYNQDVKSFAFYSKVEDLKKSYNDRGMKYRFVNANDIDIPEDTKFDLICSFKAWAFHFPLKTYADLARKHSHEDTKIILDLRVRINHTKDDRYHEPVNIIHTIEKQKKCDVVEIKL